MNLAILSLLALLGCAVRLWFGLRAELWAAAPDQLAWSVLLTEAAEGSFRWDQLIHYPHEGGTFIVSLMALALGSSPLGVPALSWVAFVLESTIRFGMIMIAWRSLGFRTAALFAGWTVFAVPSLLPWATVNFGLHAFAAFWPFAALWLVSRQAPAEKEAVGLGVLTGLGLSFSYDAFMLVFASLILVFFSHRGWKGAKSCAIYLLVTVAVVLPHLATRVLLDGGFDLAPSAALSVRGLEFSIPPIVELATNTRLAVTRSLPGASLLPNLGPLSADSTRLLWGVLLGLGLARTAWLARSRRTLLFGLLVAGTWVVLYAASPVFFDERTGQSYVAYRHFSAVLPLLILLALHAAANGSRPIRAVGLLLVLAGVWGGARALVEVTPPESANIKAAGWVLGSKLGHDPARLEALLGQVPNQDRSDLAFGYGWGIAATVLAPASPPATDAVRRVTDLSMAFSSAIRPLVINGVRHASAPGVSPRIHPAISKQLFQNRQPPVAPNWRVVAEPIRSDTDN